MHTAMKRTRVLTARPADAKDAASVRASVPARLASAMTTSGRTAMRSRAATRRLTAIFASAEGAQNAQSALSPPSDASPASSAIRSLLRAFLGYAPVLTAKRIASSARARAVPSASDSTSSHSRRLPRKLRVPQRVPPTRRIVRVQHRAVLRTRPRSARCAVARSAHSVTIRLPPATRRTWLTPKVPFANLSAKISTTTRSCAPSARAAVAPSALPCQKKPLSTALWPWTHPPVRLAHRCKS